MGELINSIPNLFLRETSNLQRKVKLIRKTTIQDMSLDDTCKLTLVTSNGANCQAFVFCDDHSLRGQDDIGHVVNENWNVCYLGGEQFMHDDAIGDFSVTFTEAGGVDGNNEDG